MPYSDILNTVAVATAVIGLVIVVISLQQTRRSINAASYQHILDREADNWNQVRNGSDYSKIMALKYFGIPLEKPKPDPIETYLSHITQLNLYEGIYLQHRQRALHKEVWETWQRSMAAAMNDPEVRETWEFVKEKYSPKFVAYIEQAASQAPDAG